MLSVEMRKSHARLRVREGDGQRVIAGDLAWLAGAEEHVVILRNVELGADHDFDVAAERGDFQLVRGLGRSGLGLAARGHAES